MKTIYLSGPITGVSYKGCTNWRKKVAEELAPDVVGVSPLRGKDYLAGMDSMPHTHDNVMSTARGIMARDRFDTMSCDALFANMLGVTWTALEEACKAGDFRKVRASIGTCMEIAWADMLRKPIILVMEEEDNIHDHPMIREAEAYCVPTLEEGTALANALLSLEYARNHH